MRRSGLYVFTALVAFGLICLFTIWSILPLFNGYTELARDDLIASTLGQGKVLTTVHFWKGSSPGRRHRTGVTYGRLIRYGSVILQWQLKHDSVDQSIVLQFGNLDNDGPENVCQINTTSLVGLEPQFLNDICSIYAKAAETGEPFNRADSVLLDQRVRNTWRDVYINMLIPEKGVIELWKWLPDWSSYTAFDIASIDQNDRIRYLLARLNVSVAADNGHKPTLADIEVKFQDALVPTLAYSAGPWLLQILAHAQLTISWILDCLIYPAIVIIGQILYYTVIMAVIYLIVAYALWSRSGTNRPFSSWAKEHWFTKSIARRLWGAGRPKTWGIAGPLDGTDDDDEILHRRHPRSLSNPLQFFRSSSPLDDLLYTFTATRWMVKPMGRSSSIDGNFVTSKWEHEWSDGCSNSCLSTRCQCHIEFIASCSSEELVLSMQQVSIHI